MAASERFAYKQHPLRYCFQLLILTTMEPFIGPLGEIRFANTAAFLQELTRVFGDSNEQATAARGLESLRQGNWSSRGTVRTSHAW